MAFASLEHDKVDILMVKVVSNIIPFSGYKAMAIYPFVFIRKECQDKVEKRTLLHESIHFAQQKEMLLIGFFIWYVIEWLIRVLFTKDRFSHQAYRNISLEREAYEHEYFEVYLKQRKHFAWLKYIVNN